MNDLGNLLQMILDLLKSWAGSFSNYATAVMEKLNLIEEDTDNLSDIKSNTDDIKDNTGAIITPVQSIQSTNSTIASDTTSIKNTVAGMSNQLTTIATNVGTASAFAEDIANNTLNCSNRLVTIGSDTTQLRSNSNNITADVADIKTALNYYIGNTIVTEDSEGSICNIDTDLEDYLQKLNVTIPSDLTGFSGITITKSGKNFINKNSYGWKNPTNIVFGGVQTGYANGSLILSAGTYAVFASEQMSGIYISDDSSNIKTVYNTIGTTFTISSTKAIRIMFYKGGATDMLTYNYQLEMGSTATAYEPYKAMTYPVTFGSTITDGAEIDLLSGVVKINSTPPTYDSITPLAVRTYKGVNNIYSDIGTSALTYRETLKHYLDKNNQ